MLDNFDAIINPPQASILAVGKISKEPFVCEESNKLVPHNIMALNLSVDHRAIDGYLGAQFLDRISFYLESPLRLLHYYIGYTMIHFMRWTFASRISNNFGRNSCYRFTWRNISQHHRPRSYL